MRLKIEARSYTSCRITLSDPDSNDLFAESHISPDKPLTHSVQGCLDSSRYFALRITDPDTGRSALVGLGFRDRPLASAFITALSDFTIGARRARVQQQALAHRHALSTPAASRTPSGRSQQLAEAPAAAATPAVSGFWRPSPPGDKAAARRVASMRALAAQTPALSPSPTVGLGLLAATDPRASPGPRPSTGSASSDRAPELDMDESGAAAAPEPSRPAAPDAFDLAELRDILLAPSPEPKENSAPSSPERSKGHMHGAGAGAGAREVPNGGRSLLQPSGPSRRTPSETVALLDLLGD